jgi:type IV secretion system protein TrbE
MLNIAEYRRKPSVLADHLPWAALVSPGIVLNKDGSFQRSFRYRGPDLESTTDAELVAISARVNNVLKRFGSGWAIFFHANRVAAPGYPSGSFLDPVSALLDEERRADFEESGSHFDTRFHLTLLCQPAADQFDRAQRFFVAKASRPVERDWRLSLDKFRDDTERAGEMLRAVMPELVPLDDGQTLSFLHDQVSDRTHPIAVPDTPIYLDALIADTSLAGGLEPRLGNLHLRTITVRGMPSLSRPALLDALNHQGFGYRWATRFIALDRADASRELTRLRRQWFNKRKSITALLREVLYAQPTELIDSDAGNKMADADLALQALGEDHISFGYLTMTITVADPDPARATEKRLAVEAVVNGLGFSTILERLNAVEAWLSSLPGHVYANVRQPIVHSLNLAHMMPLASVWAGPDGNEHLAGPPLLMARTSGTTPFRFSTHVGDVGHATIVGPTGSGKSVLLSLIAMQFRRYAGSRIILFDKGLSARAAVLAMGGVHYRLGLASDDGIAFQPLRHIDRVDERSWAAGWIAALAEHEQLLITPDLKDGIWSALTNLSGVPAAERTLTGLSLLLQSHALRQALRPFTLEGPYGALLDADSEGLSLSDVVCFETEELMAAPGALAPVLTYLFHRLETAFDGRPTLLLLDEAWALLDNPMFAGRIREWLKTLRKKNVAVIFATQSLADIADSSIAPAIIENCPQRLFLANGRAAEPQSRRAYQGFGLNDRQIEIIAQASPKRHYYLQSARGNRLFELGLGPVGLALCGTSSAADQLRIDAWSTAGVGPPFAAALLRAKGLSWSADLLDPAPSGVDA